MYFDLVEMQKWHWRCGCGLPLAMADERVKRRIVVHCLHGGDAHVRVVVEDRIAPYIVAPIDWLRRKVERRGGRVDPRGEAPCCSMNASGYHCDCTPCRKCEEQPRGILAGHPKVEGVRSVEEAQEMAAQMVADQMNPPHVVVNTTYPLQVGWVLRFGEQKMRAVRQREDGSWEMEILPDDAWRDNYLSALKRLLRSHVERGPSAVAQVRGRGIEAMTRVVMADLDEVL